MAIGATYCVHVHTCSVCWLLLSLLEANVKNTQQKGQAASNVKPGLDPTGTRTLKRPRSRKRIFSRHCVMNNSHFSIDACFCLNSAQVCEQNQMLECCRMTFFFMLWLSLKIYRFWLYSPPKKKKLEIQIIIIY